MKRLIELDKIRSICFIWIVAVWHLNTYLHPSYHFDGYLLSVFHNMTYAALGVFTFLSGVLLAKYEFHSIQDVLLFYKKRLSRFFFLLFLSALTYNILGWISTQQVIQVILGLNLFIGPSVPTLWFFSMMVFLYIITPLLKLAFSNKYIHHVHASISIIIYLFLIIIVYYLGADQRLLYYFPMYVLALHIGSERFVNMLHSRFFLLLIPLIGLMFVENLHPIIEEISGGILIVLCSKLAILNINKLWQLISVSSMIAYLFHRQFFSFIKRLFEYREMDYIPFGFAITSFILLMIISYYVQTFIDKLKNKKI